MASIAGSDCPRVGMPPAVAHQFKSLLPAVRAEVGELAVFGLLPVFETREFVQPGELDVAGRADLVVLNGFKIFKLFESGRILEPREFAAPR